MPRHQPNHNKAAMQRAAQTVSPPIIVNVSSSLDMRAPRAPSVPWRREGNKVGFLRAGLRGKWTSPG